MPKSERFRYFEDGTDPILAPAADLLACPPHLVDKNCLSCSFQPGLTLEPLGTDARHFVRCRKGLCLHGAVNDRVRDELCFIFERCKIRLIADRPGSHRQMTSFRRREGAFLIKIPDLVIPDLDARRSFTLIDIKIMDPAAASYNDMSSKLALQHRHRALWRLLAPVKTSDPLGGPSVPLYLRQPVRHVVSFAWKAYLSFVRSGH